MKKVLFAFQSISPSEPFFVFEIKDQNPPKDQFPCQWYIWKQNETNGVEKLIFSSMEPDMRFFVGDKSLDMKNQIYKDGQQEWSLKSCSDSETFLLLLSQV